MVVAYRKLLDSAARSLRAGWNASERSAFWYGVSARPAGTDLPTHEIEQIGGPQEFENTGQGRESGA